MSRYVNIPPSCESALAPEIRPLEHSKILLLDAHIDPNRLAGRHHERFAQQQYGHLTYRIAWLDDIPVGHTMVCWTGATDTFIAARITDCAHIEDLFVMPQYRSHGIGTQILVHAERIAAERGFTRIGLARRHRQRTRTRPIRAKQLHRLRLRHISDRRQLPRCPRQKAPMARNLRISGEKHQLTDLSPFLSGGGLGWGTPLSDPRRLDLRLNSANGMRAARNSESSASGAYS